MKWLGLLSRAKRAPAVPTVTQPDARAPAGIDYLLAQAGRAQPTVHQPPIEPTVHQPPAEPTDGHPAAPPPDQPPRRPALPDPGSLVEAASWEALHEQAEQAEKRADWDAAELLWRAMRVGFPDIWYAYAGGATTLCALNRHDEARQLLIEAAVRFPEERAIPIALGQLTMSLSDWPAAEIHWRAALNFDVRPWWVYTELAGALEQQGRLTEAETVLLDGQTQAEDPHEITLFIYPARLAWMREDWVTAVARWAEAQRRFPLFEELPARLYEALMRLGEHDPLAYEAALRDLGRASADDDKQTLMLRFESLGGTGPDGGCEFGCFQRRHGAEPLGLFRWATVSPASLIACLDGRFAGIGDPDATTITPHEGQWEISDAIYGTKMHSFVSSTEVSADRMMALASKRMRYLKDKLIADLENPAKIFVLKVAWDHVTTEEIEGLSRAVHRYGPVELLCVCAADQTHPEGTVVSAAAGIYIGYIDFSGQLAAAQRHSVWEGLCRGMLRVGG